jgi:hypothetical protein
MTCFQVGKYKKEIYSIFIEYIDAVEITINLAPFNSDLFKILSENLDIGKKTEMNIQIEGYRTPGDASFKEFISGKYMKHPNLNYLYMFVYNDNYFNNNNDPRPFVNAIMEVSHLDTSLAIIPAFRRFVSLTSLKSF